jgi:hypothetical protein
MITMQRTSFRGAMIRHCATACFAIAITAIRLSAADELIRIDFRNKIPGMVESRPIGAPASDRRDNCLAFQHFSVSAFQHFTFACGLDPRGASREARGASIPMAPGLCRPC